MYLAQTNLEVDTNKEFEYTNPNGTKVLVYKTKPGTFNPEIHTRRPSDQIVSVFEYADYGRNCNIHEITSRVKLALKQIN